MDAVLEILIKAALVLGIPLGSIPLILHVERRGAAFIQKRVGPNRVGPMGLLQPLADVLKFLFKEEVQPSHVRPFFYIVAPLVAFIVAILPFASLPYMAPFELGGRVIYPEAFSGPMGIFYIFAVAALGSYAILIAGWASNNKFSMLGAIRASAQMVSYELSMSITLVALFLLYGTHNIHEIIAIQNKTLLGFLPGWGVFFQPIGALIFLVGIFAESNRLPFDLAEGESELVAGYHVEYSSMKFALFYMAEYIHMFALSGIFIVLFFGGYNLLPGLGLFIANESSALPVFQLISFITKIALMMWFFIWVRWSLPRLRYDQLMNLGWKVLLPLGFINLLGTALWLHFLG